MSVHIFWDNSNIWIGAKATKKFVESSVPDHALRIHFENIHKLVLDGRTPITKVMGGSVPPQCEAVWEYGRRLGYDIDKLKRVESDDGRFCEQAVDEVMHMKIANALLDYEPPQTLIILSGDGSISDCGTSFTAQAERALKRGWNVEVYSWIVGLSNKLRELENKYSELFKICTLDTYYYSLTFVEGGEYYKKDDCGNRIYFEVRPRYVVSL